MSSGVYERFDDLSGRSSSPGRSWHPVFVDIFRPCFAEFLSMAVFTFLGTMAVLGAPDLTKPITGALLVAIANGMTICVLVIAVGAISMCHINPVVTLAFFLTGQIGLVKSLWFVLAQLLGSILGGLCIRGVLGETIFKELGGGAMVLPEGVGQWRGLLSEVTLTFALILVILLVTVEQNVHVLGPIAIGCTVVVAVLAGFTGSGPSLNPGRTFGPAVVASMFGVDSKIWTDHWVYWVGPIIGTVVATFFYLTILAGPNKRICLRREMTVPEGNS